MADVRKITSRKLRNVSLVAVGFLMLMGPISIYALCADAEFRLEAGLFTLIVAMATFAFSMTAEIGQRKIRRLKAFLGMIGHGDVNLVTSSRWVEDFITEITEKKLRELGEKINKIENTKEIITKHPILEYIAKEGPSETLKGEVAEKVLQKMHRKILIEALESGKASLRSQFAPIFIEAKELGIIPGLATWGKYIRQNPDQIILEEM